MFTVLASFTLLACGSPATEGPPGDAAVSDASVGPLDGAPADSATPADQALPRADAGEPTEVAYIVTFLGGIVAHRIDPASGGPLPVDGSPFDRGASFYSGAMDAAGRFLYAVDASKGKLHGYRVGTGGALSPVDGSPYDNPGTPITVAVDPMGRLVYVGNSETNTIGVWKMDPASGKLTPAGAPFAFGDQPTFVAAHPGGRLLYVTQRGAAGARAFKVDAGSGGLTEVQGSPFGGQAIFGGGLCFHPGGGFLYGGQLSAFKVDPDKGTLEPVAGSTTVDVGSADAQAIHVAVDAQGRRAFGISTLRGKLHVLSIDGASGALTPVAGSPFSAGSSPYSVAVDPEGAFAWVARDDGNYSAFRVAAGNGAADPVDGSPFSHGGLQPQVLMTRLPK